MKVEDLNGESSAEDFLEFYEGIPESAWRVGSYGLGIGVCCARGHLHSGNYHDRWDSRWETRDTRLSRVLGLDCGQVSMLNDNVQSKFSHLGDTPKVRICQALRNVIAGRKATENEQPNP